jgi:Alpha/beta hydrolase domain
LRAGAAAGDGCDAAGQKVDFPKTKADREATGDPRLSIEERYPTHESYVKKVTYVARQLRHRKLLIEEDVERYIEEAEASLVGR